jgi:hypothetical protein
MSQIENDTKSYNVIATMAAVFMMITAVSGYVLFDYYFNKYQLSKNSFVCTQIEQVGKNLDDVICVQYTSQRYYQQAVSLNKSAITAASYMGK